MKDLLLELEQRLLKTDYKERLKFEHLELKSRIEKLQSFIDLLDSEEYAEKIKLNYSKSLLENQLYYMKMYLDTLESRMVCETIKID